MGVMLKCGPKEDSIHWYEMGRSPLFSSTSFFTFCELATTLPKGRESASTWGDKPTNKRTNEQTKGGRGSVEKVVSQDSVIVLKECRH